jgi:OmpA-OmpF porin, OOP family
MKRLVYFFMILTGLAPFISFAADKDYKDHALLSGIPNYKIIERKETQFGTYDAGERFNCKEGKPCDSSTTGFNDQGKLVAEGKVTYLRYDTKQALGTLAVLRNYENAVKELGGRKINYTASPSDIHIFKIEKQNTNTWVVLTNYTDTNYNLHFIEEKPMQQVVTAGQLADAISKQGFATLYINFDTNKADIKAEDKLALSEVVTMLSKDKTLRISIEGHTDNVGNAAANKSLSERRGQSVMAALTAGGIDTKRLQAKGFGSEAPVADNRSEEGKAKNRRVELVKLK